MTDCEKCNDNDDIVTRLKYQIEMGAIEDIDIEADYPNLYGKIPLLDTKIWMSDDEIFFQHYEKPMSSKDVLLC